MEIGRFNNVAVAGMQGIQRGQQTVQESAQAIAGIGRDALPKNNIGESEKTGNLQNELTEAAVGLIQGKMQVSASAKVVKMADETLGQLIDTRA